MRLNACSVFYALLCSSTIVHTACGRPLLQDPIAPTDRASDAGGSPSNSRPATPDRNVLQVEEADGTESASAEIRVLARMYYRAGLRYYGTNELRMPHPVVSTEDVAQIPVLSKTDRSDGVQELSFKAKFTNPTRDVFDSWGIAELTILHDPRQARARPADRSTAKMSMYLQRPLSSVNNGGQPEIQSSHLVEIGPPGNLRFTNPVPDHPWDVGPVRPNEATSTAHHDQHGSSETPSARREGEAGR
ncbi:hypothetical protein EV361DRAFT_183857 [Lentinula raphanica]|nr:hypothetical protein EV361DRAFT_183857 [Lentinula raphanica]